MTNTEVAYIAGFWEGEGTAGISHHGRDNIKPYGRISIAQKDPFTLAYIQDLLGMGHIYLHSSNGCSHWVVGKQADVVRFIRLVYPYVQNPRKRQQLRKAYRVSRQRRSK